MTYTVYNDIFTKFEAYDYLKLYELLFEDMGCYEVDLKSSVVRAIVSR